MMHTLVRIGFGLVLCVLAKGDVFCPVEQRDAVPRFNVLCTSTSPCNNLNIYCPKSAYTDMLWLDCKGANACANISVYATVPTRVRCRTRSGACENVNIYCGDDISTELPSSALDLFTASDQGNQEVRPVSCKVRHTDSYVTQKSFFGCYGDVKSCVSLASADNAYTDSRMHCETTGAPCVMQCLTGRSCLNNELQCATTDQSLCQCQTAANCATVETTDVRGGESIETTTYSEPTETESSSSSTTEVAQSSTSTSTVSTEAETTQATQETQATQTQTTQEATQATQTTQETQTSSSVIASTTTVSSTQDQTSSTEGISTSQTVSTEPATTSTVESTSASESSTSAATTQVDGLANRQETVTDNSHVMKSWELGLAIAMPIFGVILLCLIGAYVWKHWKQGSNAEQLNKGVKDEESGPHKSISAQSVDGIMSPVTPGTISTTEV